MMVQSQFKINGRSDESIFQNSINSDHDPSINDEKIFYKNSNMDIDLNLEDRILFRSIPGISGGCIISERPVFLRNSILCVINNRKCSLYNSKNGKRICDTYSNPEMIIGSRTFIYDNKYEIIICASSDGTLLGYNIPNGLGKDMNLIDLRNFKLDVIFELKVECKNLLAIETNIETGEIICVILNKDLRTEVIKFSLDYSKILFLENNNNSNTIHIDTTSNNNNNNTNNNNHNGNNNSNKISNTNMNNHNGHKYFNGTINGYHQDGKLYGGFRSIISVDINLEIFEVDRRFSKMAIGAGKSCFVVDLKTEQCFYFENDQVITCIAFDNKGSLTIGDSSGQITVLSLFSCVYLVNKSQVSIFVSNTSSTAVLSFRLDNNDVDFTALSHQLNYPVSYSNQKNNNNNKNSNTNMNSNKEKEENNRENKNKENKEKEIIRIKVEAKRLHWHSHGVNCMCYSKNQLLSAGEEGVVVIWDLETQTKKFVTRLGAPIFHIGAREDQTIFASLQNNSIMLIDSISLSVYAKITCLSMDSGILNDNSEESRIVKYYPEFNELKDINPSRIKNNNNTNNNNNNNHNHNNNSNKNSNNNDNSNNNKGSNLRNKIIVTNNNKLQVYDYVEDCETRMIDVSNVNYVSRQDEEFGQNYQITNLCISQDSRYILVVQSRSVNTTSAEDEMEFSEDRKYIMKFYHRINKDNKNNNTNMNSNKDNKENNNEEKEENNEYDYVLQNSISNPHSDTITGLKQLYKKDKFISTSMDGRLNMYSLVKVGVDSGSNRSVVIKENKEYKNNKKEENKGDGIEMWICSCSIDYKEMPIYTLAINENNMMVLRHEMVLSLWKYPDGGEKELALLKGLVNPLGNDLLFIKFLNNETLLLCTKKEVYMYSIKYGSRSVVLSYRGDEEINGIVLKYGLLVVNVRKYVKSNFVNIVEVFDIRKNFLKIYSRLEMGVNSQLSIQLVPSAMEVNGEDGDKDRKDNENKEKEEEKENNKQNKEENKNKKEKEKETETEKNEQKEDKEQEQYEQEKENDNVGIKRKREKDKEKQKLSKWIFERGDKHYNLLILNHYSNEIEMIPVVKVGEEYMVKDFIESDINFKRIKKEDEKMNFLYKFINDVIESGRNKRQDNKSNKKNKNKEKKRRFSMVSTCMNKNKIMPKINSILEIVDETYPSTQLPSPNVIIDQMMKKLML